MCGCETTMNYNYKQDISANRVNNLVLAVVTALCLGFTVSDAVETSDTDSLPELRGVNNTGISLSYNSFGVISSANLSYETNSKTDVTQYIKFEITRESQFGCIQKLRANGFWANVTSFSQRQINRNKIRYFHFRDKPKEDILELQVSYNEIKSPVIRFRIEFRKSKLEALALNQLTVNPDIDEIPINSKDLRFDTRPVSTDPNLIVYTILSKPAFGSLYLVTGNASEELGIGSLVTQEMINELRLYYNCSDTQSLKWKNHDSFDFEVATEGGMSNVEVTSFHLKIVRTTTDEFVLTNKKLVVIEGDRATISDKILRVETHNKVGYLRFNITNKPKFGTIKLMNPQLNDVIQVSPNVVTEEQISQNRILYYHDDSEHNRDLFDFEVFDSQDNFICFATFNIEVVMKNDNPPIRVIDKPFEVVSDGQKRLTANDIKYIDADMDSSPADIKYSKTFIPNGNLYFADRPNEVAEHFTQEDIDNEKILFRHSGDESGRSILWISDGQFYASGVLEIKASKPYLRVSKNTGLVVKFGESGLITSDNLTIETNLDINRKSDVTIKITSDPKFGQMLNAGKEANRFTLQDLIDESIEYESKSLEDNSSVIHDSFTFRREFDVYNQSILNLIAIPLRPVFYNGEDYLSSRATAENQLFNISIYPHSYFQLSVINLKNISAEEDQFVVIDSSNLLVSHPTLSSDNIVYMISQLPKLGALSLLTHNTTPIAMHFPSKESSNGNKNGQKNENLLIFTQKDIDDKLIHYKYLSQNNDLKNNSFEDSFKFDVTNGITTLRDFTLHINIISKLIALYTGNISVTEGQSVVLIPDDFVASNAFYANLIDEYLIIEEPKFGKIVCKDTNDEIKVVKSFTPKLLRDGLISYAHDGSESIRDWLTVVVRANSINKESLPATIHVMIDPINDEKPYVVNNTGLELWEGSSALITNSHLAAVDDDSSSEDIIYQIQTPDNGYIATIDNKLVPIYKFSQIMIDSALILFVQRGQLSGGFRFEVTDGSLWSPQHAFVVNARPVVMSMIANKKLHVLPRMQQSVTRDHLLVETNDGNHSREFAYNLIREPRYGRFLLENADGTTKYTSSFTQKQINENIVLYEQNKPINDLLVEDQIVFDIESHFVKPLKGIHFSVVIAISSSAEDSYEMTQLIETSSLTVTKGQFSVISEENLNVTQFMRYWQKKNLSPEKLYIKVQRNPLFGSVLFKGHEVGVSVKSVPVTGLTTNQLIYKHDGNNTFNDSFILSIHFRNGADILLSNHTIDVIVVPVSDDPPVLLTTNPRIQVIYDSKTLITNSVLKVRDSDEPPHHIIYEIFTDPITTNMFGFLMIEPKEQPIESFTQSQVDSNLVYFKHRGLSTEEKQLKFRIKSDKSVCPHSRQCSDFHTMTMVTRQSSLQLQSHSNVQLIQGSITTNIEPKHLSVVSDDMKAEDIVFFIREAPISGYIIVDDKTNNEKFRQIDINSLKVSYIQINKTSNDFFVVDVVGVQRGQIRISIKNITVAIVVKPLVRAKRPFLVASPGKRSLITTEHLDASELAAITQSVPKFRIKANPKFGVLKKFVLDHDSNKNRVKRKTSSYKILTEFTNEDILKSRITYIANHDLNIRAYYPNEVLTDVIAYELSAPNVATASGVLVVNIFDNKVIDKLMSKDLGTNISDLDERDIGAYDQNNEMSYLQILITRDHLLIAFVFVVVVILTVALIVIIRFCHSTASNQTIHKDSKSGPINARLGTGPTILETPPISDYGTEMLALSHRLSPRSTPSLSETDTGIPMAPPTSPSLSTNCSFVESRSHTATPRSLLRLPMAGRLRGGCAALDDMPPELTTSNIFPLPPPSLYFENESNLSPTTDWHQSSVPVYKVPRGVPRCLDAQYPCSPYSHNLCSPNHNNNVDMSLRMLGDGTSLVGSPVPSLRRTLYTSPDLSSPTLSPSHWADPSLRFKNAMNYTDINSPTIQNSSDVYITDDLNGDTLELQYELGESSALKQKQQYWV